MAAFTTLADVKAWLPVNGDADDTLLTNLIVAASAFIEVWIGRTLALTTYTAESYDGPGGARLALRHYPVVSVSELTIDGVTIPQATSPTANGWIRSSSGAGLVLRGYSFTSGIENVAVTYSAGFTSIPDDIAQACKELVGLRYKERDRIGFVSKAISGEVVTFTQRDMSEGIKTLLNAYREVRPV